MRSFRLPDWAGIALAFTIVLPAHSAQTLRTAPAAPLGRPMVFEAELGTPGAFYAFDLGGSGTQPGFTVPGSSVVIPLQRPWLWFDLFGFDPALAPIFAGFWGTAGAQGRATPTFFAPILDGLEGQPLWGCCTVLDPAAPGGVSTTTNPVLTVVVRRAVAAAGARAPFLAPAPAGAATRYVSPSGLDSNDGLTPATAWRTLAHAALSVAAGDIVDVADGAYQGPVIIDQVQGTAAAPVVFRATGNAAILTGSGSTNNTNRNSIYVGGSSHVVIHGLKVFASQRAGCRVSLSDHVTIQNCVFGNHQKWGIFTDYADDLLLVGNECYGSIDEHGIYLSNSGDRPVVVGNFCHDNHASGIQINADPDFLAPIGGYVPDGITDHALVERNFCLNDGAVGGAAINLASVRSSVFRDNLIVNTAWANSTGIALWDNGAGSVWGSRDNLIEHNTVAFFSGTGRYAVSLLNGSTGNRLRNNVLRGGRRGALAWTIDSLPGLESDGNLLHSVDGWPVLVQDDAVFQSFSLAAWQSTGRDLHSIQANALFANPQTSSPATGDWSLLPGSPGRDAGRPSGWYLDHQGGPRPLGPGIDMGAFER